MLLILYYGTPMHALVPILYPDTTKAGHPQSFILKIAHQEPPIMLIYSFPCVAGLTPTMFVRDAVHRPGRDREG